jgi:hypothetical protein
MPEVPAPLLEAAPAALLLLLVAVMLLLAGKAEASRLATDGSGQFKRAADSEFDWVDWPADCDPAPAKCDPAEGSDVSEGARGRAAAKEAGSALSSAAAAPLGVDGEGKVDGALSAGGGGMRRGASGEVGVYTAASSKGSIGRSGLSCLDAPSPSPSPAAELEPAAGACCCSRSLGLPADTPGNLSDGSLGRSCSPCCCCADATCSSPFAFGGCCGEAVMPEGPAMAALDGSVRHPGSPASELRPLLLLPAPAGARVDAAADSSASAAGSAADEAATGAVVASC